MRRVEREAAGLELVDRRAVVGAGVALAVAALLEVRGLVARRRRRRRDEDHALAEPEGGLDGVGEPGGVGVRHRKPGLGVDRPAVGAASRALRQLGVADDEPIDDDLDRMALVLVEGRRVGEVVHLPVDADADEALPPGALEDPVALGLAVLDQRPEDEEARALRQREHLVDDLLDRLPLDLPAAGRAVRMADPGEEEPEVVVDLRDRPDRRSRVPAGALLVDRDRRRQAVDLVDVRLLHLAEELAGVGRQALDVAALALGVDRVEREAALAAAGEPGDDDEPVARERDGDVLEVVFAGTANDELILGHVAANCTRT